eukprot:Selendium_serpulae@DN180_c0_g1_i2.p2
MSDVDAQAFRLIEDVQANAAADDFPCSGDDVFQLQRSFNHCIYFRPGSEWAGRRYDTWTVTERFMIQCMSRYPEDAIAIYKHHKIEPGQKAGGTEYRFKVCSQDGWADAKRAVGKAGSDAMAKCTKNRVHYSGEGAPGGSTYV